MFTQPDSALGDLTLEEMRTKGGVSISNSSDVLSPAEKSDVLARSVDFESLRMRAGRWTGRVGVEVALLLDMLCFRHSRYWLPLETRPL